MKTEIIEYELIVNKWADMKTENIEYELIV